MFFLFRKSNAIIARRTYYGDRTAGIILKTLRTGKIVLIPTYPVRLQTF